MQKRREVTDAIKALHKRQQNLFAEATESESELNEASLSDLHFSLVESVFESLEEKSASLLMLRIISGLESDIIRNSIIEQLPQERTQPILKQQVKEL